MWEGILPSNIKNTTKDSVGRDFALYKSNIKKTMWEEILPSNIKKLWEEIFPSNIRKTVWEGILPYNIKNKAKDSVGRDFAL